MRNPSLEQDYALFGLPATSTPREVRSAYLKAIKKWHPDLFPPGEARDRATEKVRLLNAAYARIKSAPLRFIARRAAPPESTAPIEFREERSTSWFSGWADAHDRLAEKAPQNRGITALYLALLGTLFALILVVIGYNIDLELGYRKRIEPFILAGSVFLPIHLLHVVDAVRGRLIEADVNSPIQGLWHGISRVTFIALPYVLVFSSLRFLIHGYTVTTIWLALNWIVVLLLKRRLSAD